MIKLAVSGCQGRMGQRITQLAIADKDFKITTLLEHKDHPQAQGLVGGIKIQTDPAALKGCDVLIEFTSPQATLEHLTFCQKYKVKMVIGTTGLKKEEIEQIQKASSAIPLVFSSNMSVGVNLLFRLAQLLSAKTPNYEIRIIEAHHIHKKDAPSGTAKTLAETIEKNSNHRVKDIQAIREGEIVGDHKVIFESAEDTLIIEHHAKTRDIFAKGSLVAAKFLRDKTKGLFTMQEVLEF
jgi:4-hydroxy-tetrahydrodipicolinate reductase